MGPPHLKFACGFAMLLSARAVSYSMGPVVRRPNRSMPTVIMPFFHVMACMGRYGPWSFAKDVDFEYCELVIICEVDVILDDVALLYLQRVNRWLRCDLGTCSGQHANRYRKLFEEMCMIDAWSCHVLRCE